MGAAIVGLLVANLFLGNRTSRRQTCGCTGTEPLHFSYATDSSAGVLADLVSKTPAGVYPNFGVLIVTWRNLQGTALATALVPAEGVYRRIGDSFDPSMFNADFVEAFGDLTIDHVYQYSDKLAFVRNKESTGINRFALLGIIDGKTLKVFTAEDVGTSQDATTYAGAWNYTYDSSPELPGTYIDVSQTFLDV